jgi:hypothetical protein
VPIFTLVEKIVAVVICALVAVPTGASATAESGKLLRAASRLSGLAARRPVPATTLSGSLYDSLLTRSVNRDYPRALQRTDTRLYAGLGLSTRSMRTHAPVSRAWYDPAGRRLLLRRTPTPGRTRVLHELVRALVDQNFGLRRLAGLRSRDRDRALAATAIVDGTAAFASGVRAGALHGTPLERFLQLDREAGLGPGQALAAELHYLGGRAALATALRTFPQTTEQLLHVDKFLERETALPVRLPSRIGTTTLTSSQTFGELEVRNLLRAVRVPGAAAAADGWGGGQLALYVSADGGALAALVLRWDTPEDAAEWRDAVPGYITAAFAGAIARDCPPLDRCWSTATTELAAGALGENSVLVSGQGADAVASALLR